MNDEHLSREADRLINDPIFAKALDAIRADALAALATVDIDDRTAVLRLQAHVAAVDAIRAMLTRYIVAAEPAQDDASPFA